MYNATSTEVQQFVAAYTRVVGYNYPLTATTRKKYIAVDRDGSGVFLVERTTGRVYNVKGYGQRGLWVGTLSNLTSAYNHTERMKVVPS